MIIKNKRRGQCRKKPNGIFGVITWAWDYIFVVAIFGREDKESIPTHYAVALKFVLHGDIAPIVVAKGTDLLGIKELAREYHIPIREQPKLARDLYRLCEIDDYIPQELFRAVEKSCIPQSKSLHR